MTNILVHQFELSPFCDKVRRVLHYKDLPFEVNNIPVGELRKLKKMSPICKVPVLEIDGDFIADSSDICRELERRFPDRPILPTHPADLALVNIIEDWADESLYFFELTMRFTWHYDRDRWLDEMLKRDNKFIKMIGKSLVFRSTKKHGFHQGLARRSEQHVLRELARHISSLEALLEKTDFLAGQYITLADIAVVSQLECIAGSSLGLPLIKQPKSLSDWIARVHELTGGPTHRGGRDAAVRSKDNKGQTNATTP